MDEFVTLVILCLCAAFVVAAFAEFFIRRWLVAAIVGVAVSQAIFLSGFGLLDTRELIMSVLFSAIPALLGVAGTAIIIKRRGL